MKKGLVETGIPGFDNVLNGGFPADRVYLIAGEPGSGKTTFAMQFLLAGVARGEKVLYITLSETREEIDEIARSHGWSLAGVEILELSTVAQRLEATAENTLFHSSEVELTETTRLLTEAVERVSPSRLVFDSLSEYRLLSQTSLRHRRRILGFKQFFAGKKCTALFLDDLSSGDADHQLESIAHGVVMLDQSAPSYGVQRRRLFVRKIRGASYRGGYHDFLILKGGITLFPRLIAAEHHRHFQAEELPSGIVQLDKLTGGGLSRGTSNLFLGPPGVGKSTLALQYIMRAAEQGERSIMYSFDESEGVMLQRAHGLHAKLPKYLKDGTIQVRKIDPAEISPGELNFHIRQAVEGEKVRIVLIDSLNGYMHSMQDERFLSLQLHELCTYLNQQGVLTMLVLSQQGLLSQMQAPIDVTYLADTVIALRFFEARGAVHQAISVIKKRTGDHERSIRQFRISRHGIEVGEPLVGFRGVLTGTPVPPENENDHLTTPPAAECIPRKRRSHGTKGR